MVFFERIVSAFVVSLVKNLHHLATYEERCKKLGWPDLSAHRDYLSLIECYKIVFRIIDNLNFGNLFEKSKSSCTRANHRYKLYVKMAMVNSYKLSFFAWIIRLWNNLPSGIVESDSINVFKNLLKQLLNIKETVWTPFKINYLKQYLTN